MIGCTDMWWRLPTCSRSSNQELTRRSCRNGWNIIQVQISPQLKGACTQKEQRITRLIVKTEYDNNEGSGAAEVGNKEL